MSALTVVIPTYNALHTLPGLIDSLLIDKRVEYLFVDSSDDGTQQFLASLGHTWFATAPKGIFAAQNVGLANASGQWIHFMGADDRYILHGLETLLGVLPKLKRNNALRVMTQLQGKRFMSPAVHHHSYQQGMVYRTKTLRDVGGFAVEGTDLDLQTTNERLLRVGAEALPIALAVVNIDGRSSSLSKERPNFAP